MQLGLLLIENEKAPEALKQLEVARQQLQPSFALAFGLGTTYLQLQRPAEAAVSFEEAIALKPDARAYFYLGKAYAQLKDARSVEALHKPSPSMQTARTHGSSWVFRHSNTKLWLQ